VKNGNTSRDRALGAKGRGASFSALATCTAWTITPLSFIGQKVCSLGLLVAACPTLPKSHIQGASALTVLHSVGISKIQREPKPPTWQITIRMHLLTIMEAVIVAASHTRSSSQSSRLSLHAIAVYAPRFGLPPTQCSIQIAESLPIQKGYLWTFPSSDDLYVVEKGDGTLKEYLFANKTMSHMFCPNCTSISGLISSDVVWEACIRST